MLHSIFILSVPQNDSHKFSETLKNIVAHYVGIQLNVIKSFYFIIKRIEPLRELLLVFIASHFELPFKYIGDEQKGT